MNRQRHQAKQQEQELTQLYIVEFQYADSDNFHDEGGFLEFAFMDQTKAAAIRQRLSKLEAAGNIVNVYVGPVQNNTGSEHDILQSIAEVEAQFDEEVTP